MAFVTTPALLPSDFGYTETKVKQVKKKPPTKKAKAPKKFKKPSSKKKIVKKRRSLPWKV